MGGMAIAGGVASAVQLYQGFQNADAIKAQADFQKAQAEHNAQLAELKRSEVFKMAEEDIEDKQFEVRRMMGAQKSSLAANGISLDSDLAMELEAESRDIGASDIQKIKNNAWREAWGLSVEADNIRQSAKFNSSAAAQSAQNSIISGGANALSTVSNIKWGK